MKRIVLLFAVIVVALSSTTSAFAKGGGGSTYTPDEFSGKPVMVGDTVRIAGNYTDMWQTVVNPRGIGRFEFGSQCLMHYGAMVKVVGIENENILIRYTTSNKSTKKLCSSGALFLKGANDINSMRRQEKYDNERLQKRKETQDMIERLLKKK